MIGVADLIDRFGADELQNLTDREAHAVIDHAVVGRAIADIARYYLHEDGATGIVKERYLQAIAWLKEVMKHPEMLTGMGDTTPAQPLPSVAVRPNELPAKPWAN